MQAHLCPYESPKSKLVFLLGMPEVYAMFTFYMGCAVSYFSYKYWDFSLISSLLFFAGCCYFTRIIGRGKASRLLPKIDASPTAVFEKTERPLAIVTGSSSGIGLGTVRSLVKLGTSVIMAVRDVTKGEEVKKMVVEEFGLSYSEGDEMLTVMYCDLDELESVHKFAEVIRAEHSHVSMLINNAGAMVTKYKLIASTEPAVGSAFTTNVLGHFLLTALLLDQLIENKARIVNVSSAIAISNPDDLKVKDCLMNNQDKWDAPTAYGRTKLCNLWFNAALQKRLNKIQFDKGILTEDYTPRHEINHCISTAVHPGTVWSPFHMPFYKDTFSGLLLWFPVLMMPMAFFAMKSLEEGARTSIHCAVARNPVYTKFLSPTQRFTPGIQWVLGPQPGQFHQESRVTAIPPIAADEDKYEELWNTCLQLVKPYLNNCKHTDLLQ